MIERIENFLPGFISPEEVEFVKEPELLATIETVLQNREAYREYMRAKRKLKALMAGRKCVVVPPYLAFQKSYERSGYEVSPATVSRIEIRHIGAHITKH